MVFYENAAMTADEMKEQLKKTVDRRIQAQLLPRNSFKVVPLPKPYKQIQGAQFSKPPARNQNPAMLNIPGGIDLNSTNMGMTVTKDANGGVKVTVDPAMIAQVQARGLKRIDPVIINVAPMSPMQLQPLLGFAPGRDEEEQLAKI